MDRALFGDEPLIVFITIYCFLVFNFEFYFLQRYCTKVASLDVIGPFCKCAIGCWQLSGKFVTGGKEVLATLWQICYRVSGGYWELWLATYANRKYFPKGCQYPLILSQWKLIILQSSCQSVLYNLYRHLQEGCCNDKERGNFSEYL